MSGETACATIAVIDPELRSRQQMGRAIRRLGHWPLVFTSALELMQACRYLHLRFDAVVVACPVDAGAAGALIAQVREQVGLECPLVLSGGKRGLRELAVLHARESDHVEVTPASFEEAYLLMRCFLQWHRARVSTTASAPEENRRRQREPVRRAGERAWGSGAAAPGSAA